MSKPSSVIIGQEAICPDGLGRVSRYEYGPTGEIDTIAVDTYIDNRSCHWAAHNVQLVPVRTIPDNELALTNYTAALGMVHNVLVSNLGRSNVNVARLILNELGIHKPE